MTTLTILLGTARPLFAADGAREIAELGVIGVLLVAAIAVALAGAALASALRKLRGTTLVAPAVWALVSLGTIVVIQATLLRAPTYRATREKLDLLAAASTFCPIVSLLGAKRPQHRAWQFIVLSLWILAAFPALQSLAMQPGERMSVHALWQWLFAVLIFVGCANYLPTRFVFPALLFAVGQCALLCDFLPGGRDWLTPWRSKLAFEVLPELTVFGRRDYRLWQLAAGIVPVAAAVCTAWLIARRRSRMLLTADMPWNRVWRDFRDAYGALWSLRVIDRINVQAYGAGAPIRLMTWKGLQLTDSPRTDRVASADEATNDWSSDRSNSELQRDHELRSMLLRFVSNEWIDRRLQTSVKVDP